MSQQAWQPLDANQRRWRSADQKFEVPAGATGYVLRTDALEENWSYTGQSTRLDRNRLDGYFGSGDPIHLVFEKRGPASIRGWSETHSRRKTYPTHAPSPDQWQARSCAQTQSRLRSCTDLPATTRSGRDEKPGPKTRGR